MQTPMETSKEQNQSDPLIGTVSLNELPRTSSLGSNAALIGGYIGTAITSDLVQNVISDIAKEDTSAHKIASKDGFGAIFAKIFKRDLDPKLWKSNTGYWTTLLVGVALTNYTVKKIEQHNFASKHGTLPRMDQVNKILAGDDTWQEKSKRSEETQHSI